MIQCVLATLALQEHLISSQLFVFFVVFVFVFPSQKSLGRMELKSANESSYFFAPKVLCERLFVRWSFGRCYILKKVRGFL
jgi:hypothetical protein